MLSRKISSFSRLIHRNVSTAHIIRPGLPASAIVLFKQPAINQTSRLNNTTSESIFGLHLAARRLCTITRSNSSNTNEVDKGIGSAATDSKKPPEILDGFNPRAKRPSKMDRRILVLMGRYKSDEEIPDFVSDTVINATKNKFRIAVNIGMGACTLLGALVMIYIGRKRMHAGESIVGMNLDRRKDYYSKEK
ncbi:protein FAM162A-like [Anneissia japonica]|uniref:protein FAM162A-like n=1 Tax=Anneissia japonica TaxID=1529436 RepID=UPI0014259FB1|nr:protein FAM162A-like [Anneissia japonica]